MGVAAATSTASFAGRIPASAAIPLRLIRALRRTLISFAALALVSLGLPAFGAQAGQADDSYTVRGTVVNSVTDAAVPRALVFTPDNRFAKLTDDEGHFEFKLPRPKDEQNRESGVVAHRQALTLFAGSRFGNVNSADGFGVTTENFLARKPGYFQSLGQIWTAGETQGSSEMRIELVPEALIVGRVILPVQDGTERIQVQVYRRQVQDGRVQWVPAGGVTTRANGDFRVANLEQGDYKLFTSELLERDPLTFNPRGPAHGYPPMYYPAAGDFESAAVIHLKAGDTFQAALTPAKREYYPVKLGVLNAPSDGGLGLQVEPQGRRGPGFSLSYNMNDRAIEGLLPNGSYTVEVTQYGESGAAGTLNFSVNGARVEGPAVMLAANPPVEVRVRDERTSNTNTLAPGMRNLVNSMSVRLVSTDEFGPTDYLRLQPPQNPDDETLRFAGLLPGSYRVRIGNTPAGYVAALSSGGADLLRQPLVVGTGAAVPPLEITIRDDGARVDGNIENWPAGGQNSQRLGFSRNSPTVVLLPLPDSTGQFCQAWVMPDGKFQFAQVAPGDYRAIAFDHLPEDLEYGSAEAMKKYESKGQVLRVEAEQAEHLRLSLDGGSN